MNKKGFTLVELLAVVIILGLLVAIISPVVKNLINDSEDSLSKHQMDMVITATKKYMVEHSELLPEGSNRSIIYMSDLIDKGVIDNDKIIDPKTKEEINGCVVVSYNDSFNQYEYNYSESDCLITVTFDPEGGSVDTTSKQVKFNSTYGELPTPTREGYTFKGWRGKNMFDSSRLLEATDWTEENGVYSGDIRFLYQKYHPSYSGGKYFLNIFKPKTVYSLSFETKNATINGGVKFAFNYLEEGVDVNYNPGTSAFLDFKKYSLHSKSNMSINGIYISYNYRQIVWLKNIQLEEGDTVTEFEPYQEYSSDTVVTKSSNHTLHAIWEVAS